jgi:hypothetical protein
VYTLSSLSIISTYFKTFNGATKVSKFELNKNPKFLHVPTGELRVPTVVDVLSFEKHRYRLCVIITKKSKLLPSVVPLQLVAKYSRYKLSEQIPFPGMNIYYCCTIL